jgi:hypothetical protein
MALSVAQLLTAENDNHEAAKNNSREEVPVDCKIAAHNNAELGCSRSGEMYFAGDYL